MSDLRKFDSYWTLDAFEGYTNGCYIPLDRKSVNNEKVEQYITELVKDPDWTEVLVSWSW